MPRARFVDGIKFPRRPEPRDLDAIDMRTAGKSFGDIAKALGVSTERAMQIYKRALVRVVAHEVKNHA
jgi:transposase-like protein